MASYKEHCAECQEKLGNPWCVVHRWLDEFFVQQGCHERHREIRHHQLGIQEVRKKWGEQAAEAAQLHIANDFYGFIPEDAMDVQKWNVGVIMYPPKN